MLSLFLINVPYRLTSFIVRTVFSYDFFPPSFGRKAPFLLVLHLSVLHPHDAVVMHAMITNHCATTTEYSCSCMCIVKVAAHRQPKIGLERQMQHMYV